MSCENCKKVLLKKVGKTLYMLDGSFISGQDFDLVVKCECGQLMPVSYEKGVFKVNGEEYEPKPDK